MEVIPYDVSALDILLGETWSCLILAKRMEKVHMAKGFPLFHVAREAEMHTIAYVFFGQDFFFVI